MKSTIPKRFKYFSSDLQMRFKRNPHAVVFASLFYSLPGRLKSQAIFSAQKYLQSKYRLKQITLVVVQRIPIANSSEMRESNIKKQPQQTVINDDHSVKLHN